LPPKARIVLLGPPGLHVGDWVLDLAASEALPIAWLAFEGALPRRRAAEPLGRPRAGGVGRAR
jgi:hypothetical protein